MTQTHVKPLVSLRGAINRAIGKDKNARKRLRLRAAYKRKKRQVHNAEVLERFVESNRQHELGRYRPNNLAHLTVHRAKLHDWQRTRKGTKQALTIPDSAKRLTAQSFIAWRKAKEA